MKNNKAIEYIKQNLPKSVSNHFHLTGKKIYAHNLKKGQCVVGYMEESNKKDKFVSKSRCVYLAILGFVDSWALEQRFLDKVKTRIQYFEEEPIEVDEVAYTSVREYKKDYDTSGLSDEGFENAVYEEPILYAKRIYDPRRPAPKKPFVLLRATEDEKLEWKDKDVITWFELKKN
jgi:hypothetical protein